jgi:hypothetical protein
VRVRNPRAASCTHRGLHRRPRCVLHATTAPHACAPQIRIEVQKEDAQGPNGWRICNARGQNPLASTDYVADAGVADAGVADTPPRGGGPGGGPGGAACGGCGLGPGKARGAAGAAHGCARPPPPARPLRRSSGLTAWNSKEELRPAAGTRPRPGARSGWRCARPCWSTRPAAPRWTARCSRPRSRTGRASCWRAWRRAAREGEGGGVRWPGGGQGGPTWGGWLTGALPGLRGLARWSMQLGGRRRGERACQLVVRGRCKRVEGAV